MIYKRIGHLDVTIHGVRYREELNTTDKRQAKELEENRIAEIKQGKNASKAGREFARKLFHEAVKVYVEEREPRVSERTTQFETERLGPLMKHLGEKPLLRFKAEDVSGYQKARLDAGISGRTINMETGVLRRMLKRANVWNAISEDVKALPEEHGTVAKVLPPDLKRKLFETAASRPEWMVGHCAAVLAVSTTCRGVEIKNLRWQDVDFFGRVATIRRSKTAAGHRTIPLNGDAMAALARLLERAGAPWQQRARALRFPRLRGAVHRSLSFPQKSWRTAWRKLVRETARRVGREAAQAALESSKSLRAAIAAWKRAAAPIRGLRFQISAIRPSPKWPRPELPMPR